MNSEKQNHFTVCFVFCRRDALFSVIYLWLSLILFVCLFLHIATGKCMGKRRERTGERKRRERKGRKISVIVKFHIKSIRQNILKEGMKSTHLRCSHCMSWLSLFFLPILVVIFSLLLFHVFIIELLGCL